MLFEFDRQSVFTQSIDIVDIGNFALRCTSTDNMTEYYVLVKTVCGKVGILRFGPVVPDAGVLLPDFSLTYKVIDYKETKINREVSTFINDPYKEINQVEELTAYEAITNLPSISLDTLLS